MDELLCELRAAGVGCRIGGSFVGAASYCDDLILLYPTRSAFQAQMKICENYAASHNLVFSTNPEPSKCKTKFLLFRLNSREENPAPVILNNQPLFWVERATHLGHEFDTSGKQGLDCKIKRVNIRSDLNIKPIWE